MKKKFPIVGFLAAALRDAGRWVVRRAGRSDAAELRIARAKRRREQALRSTGLSRTQAAAIVAEQFRSARTE